MVSPAAAKNRSSLPVTALEYSWFKEDWILLPPMEKKSRAWESRADSAVPWWQCCPRLLGAFFSTVLARCMCVCSVVPKSVRPRGL